MLLSDALARRAAILGAVFDLTKVQDAHDRRRCKDQNGCEPWACGGCDCTERLERKLQTMGRPFPDSLRRMKR